MKIAIIGTGAVGGYYGGLLAKAGKDVHFLLRSDYSHVVKKGLRVDSKNGDFHLSPVQAYQHAEDMPQCDVVIVALKTTHNDQLRDILPKVVKDNGIVVVLQNGLGNEEEISAFVPSITLIGGLCFICSRKVAPGHIRHEDYGYIKIGQYSPDQKKITQSDELTLVLREFQEAGIDAKILDDLAGARWRKLVWNVPFNGLSVILDASTDKIINHGAAYELSKDLMQEVLAGANACGYKIEEDFVKEMLEATEKMVAYLPSMKLDFEHQRPLEIDYIYWNPIRASKQKGYLMRVTKALALQLEYLTQKQNR